MGTDALDADGANRLRARIVELEAALEVLSNPTDYPDLRGYHSGVRSVYGQAVHEGRNDITDWMANRWMAALEKPRAERAKQEREYQP